MAMAMGIIRINMGIGIFRYPELPGHGLIYT